jgi:hypothetical protein
MSVQYVESTCLDCYSLLLNVYGSRCIMCAENKDSHIHCLFSLDINSWIN